MKKIIKIVICIFMMVLIGIIISYLTKPKAYQESQETMNKYMEDVKEVADIEKIEGNKDTNEKVDKKEIEDNKQEKEERETLEEKQQVVEQQETAEEKRSVEKKVEPWEDFNDVINRSEQEALKKPMVEQEVIEFPYTIPNTNLVIRKIEGYDGTYLEDGADKNVADVATMLLENVGSSDVEFATVTIESSGQTFLFEASVIPCGAVVIVQEKNKAQFVSGEYKKCSAEVAETETLQMSENIVSIENLENNSLSVTNLTNETIPCVRVFYKFYMEDENAYIGGITYTAKLIDLEPGESQIITPKHYMNGYSRIVMVRTYDVEE